MSGFTARNFLLRDNDIIYIPPTFLGAIARFLERLLSPLAVAVNTLLGVATVRQAYDIVTGQAEYGRLFFRF